MRRASPPRAYTEMAMSGAGAPPEDEIDFTLDRPFLFALTDAQACPSLSAW